jgi:transposase-like protein
MGRITFRAESGNIGAPNEGYPPSARGRRSESRPPCQRVAAGTSGAGLRAFKILGEITRPRIERDHCWQTESQDSDGGRHLRVGRRLEALNATDAERSELTSLVARPKTAQALASRARIILACADGLENKDVARQLGVHPHAVGKWRRRFLAQRIEGLHDDRGAPRTIGDERIEAVITRTLESQPQAATHWSSRGMARDSGLSVSTVQRTELTATG